MNLARKYKLNKNFNIPYTLNSNELLIEKHINKWLDDLIIYKDETESRLSFIYDYVYYMNSDGKWILKKSPNEWEKDVMYFNLDLWIALYQTFFKDINLNRPIPTEIDNDVNYVIKHCIEKKLNISLKKVLRHDFSFSEDIENKFLEQRSK